MLTLPRRCGTRPQPREEAPARQDRREPTRRHSCTSLDGLGRESKRVRGRGLSILGLQESKLFAACTPFRRPKSFEGGQSSNARAPNCSRVCDNVSTRIFTCRAERLVAPLVCRASEPGTSHGPPHNLEARARTTPRRRRRKNRSTKPPRRNRPAPARREYTMYS